MIETKTQAIDLFGSRRALCDALEISAGALSQWPEELTKGLRFKVIGAAYENGLITPPASPEAVAHR